MNLLPAGSPGAGLDGTAGARLTAAALPGMAIDCAFLRIRYRLRGMLVFGKLLSRSFENLYGLVKPNEKMSLEELEDVWDSVVCNTRQNGGDSGTDHQLTC